MSFHQKLLFIHHFTPFCRPSNFRSIVRLSTDLLWIQTNLHLFPPYHCKSPRDDRHINHQLSRLCGANCQSLLFPLFSQANVSGRWPWLFLAARFFSLPFLSCLSFFHLSISVLQANPSLFCSVSDMFVSPSRRVVVRRRLNGAGLPPFCCPLSSPFRRYFSSRMFWPRQSRLLAENKGYTNGRRWDC